MVKGGVLNNCFETTTALVGWLANTRRPNVSSPLVVKVGAGTFGAIALTCNAASSYTGSISFVGAGRQQTTFSNGSGGAYPVSVSNCTDLAFSDLAIRGSIYPGYINWNGGGSSRWTNLDVDTLGRIWTEEVCGSSRGEHYWFGSRLRASDEFTAAGGYRATCDESWFFGSEILMDVDCYNQNGTYVGGPNAAVAFNVFRMGEVHVYGSVIRTRATCPTKSGTFLMSVAVSDTNQPGGEIHMHGTGIDVISEDTNNVMALGATSGGLIHANAVSYNLSTTAGTVTRIGNAGGHIHAPYLWEAHPTPPAIQSVTGADMAVVTDGAQPHLVIYSSNCTSKWFDTSTNACRP